MAPTPRPLEGKTVIDFTQIGAGPTCTMILADLGARVVKIEPPEGDIGRTLGPGWIDGVAALFHGFNRNKQGLTLDLKSEVGQEVALRLIADADVVVESMRPGVMDRLGLGETTCKAAQPDLVYCSVSAYGQTGPYSRRAGVDGIMQADSGLMSLIGFPETGPAKVQTPIVDVFTGYVAACGVLASLMIRQGDERPQLDISLFRSAIALQQAAITSYLVDGEEPRKQGSAAPYSAPNEAFPTADGWIMVAAYNGGRWERLCDVLGCPELAAAPGLATSGERVANRQHMVAVLTEHFSRRTNAEWFELLSEADILCAPVSTYGDLLRHPQVVQADLFAQVPRSNGDPIMTPGPAIRFHGTEQPRMTAAPPQSGDPREVLHQFGFSDEEIDAAIAARCFGGVQ